MRSTDEVFVRTVNQVEALPARTFREGFAGKNLEEALQDLLAQNPNLLPGRQMDPSSEDPPRFCLLTREMPVFGWALDHLFVDQYGVLTLIETKLLQNPESRREVIGQILEYAANARDAWPVETLRAIRHQSETSIDDRLREVFGFDDNALQEFWAKVQRNLQLGRLRLMVVGDELRPEIRRILLYLNQEMTNVEIFGLEIRCFGDETRQIIVPYLIGAVAESKSATVTTSTTWTPELLRGFKGAPDARSFLRVMEWACDAGVFLKSTTKDPAFGIRSSAGARLATFFLNSNSYFSCGAEVFRGGVDERNALFDDLKSVRLYPKDLDLTSLNLAKNTVVKLSDLSVGEIEGLLSILEKYTRVEDEVALATSTGK